MIIDSKSLKTLPHKEWHLTTSRGVDVKVREFGLVDYKDSLTAMKKVVEDRKADDKDEIWLLQHPPVYTQGTACDLETFLPNGIEVVKTDRGGQITYHGPGQWVMYPLLRLKQHSLGVKALVSALQHSVVSLLATQGVNASSNSDAPGVYVEGAKIAALGLRIRRGTSYHGLSFNVDMDVSPFLNIDPCGYKGLRVCQASDFIDINKPTSNMDALGKGLVQHFTDLL